MTAKRLTLAEIRRLNDASRKRSLAMRKQDTVPVIVREADPGGHAYTIKIVERSKHEGSNN
jgi:hypothetical protein